ncbi:hypothetical protein AGMMS50212_07330 [Spirochaetia bacterium]|nr:hypothetical protein AGMMS50212_07330 [Spirochaetia bacterium]
MQEQIFQNVEVLRDRYVFFAEKTLGKTIRYASIKPSLFGTIDIRAVSLTGKVASYKDLNLPDIFVKRLRVRYSLRELLSGSIPSAVLGLRLDKPDIMFNSEVELKDFFVRRPDGNSSVNIAEKINPVILVLKNGFSLRITGGSGFLRAGGSKISLANLTLRAKAQDGRVNFKTNWNADAALAGFFKSPFNAAIPGKISGFYDAKKSESEIRTAFTSVTTDIFSLKNIVLKAGLKDNNIIVQKTGGRKNLDLNLRYDLDNSIFAAAAEFNRFSPPSMITWLNKTKTINNYQRLRITGDAALNWDRQNGFAYNADLDGTTENSFPFGTGLFQLAGFGDLHGVDIQNFNIELDRGRLSWIGNMDFDNILPNGTLVVDNFNFTKSGDKEKTNSVNGEFLITGYDNTIILWTDTLAFGSTELSAFDGSITRNAGKYDLKIKALRFKNMESYENVALSNIGAVVSFDTRSNELEGRLELEYFSLRDLMEIARSAGEIPHTPSVTENIINNITMTTEIFVSTDFKHILYNVPRLVTVLESNKDVWASSSISGTDKYFNLDESHIVWKNGSVDLDGNAEFTNVNDILFNVGLSRNNSYYVLNGNVLDKRSVSLSSPSGLTANFSMSEDQRFSGFILVDNMQVPIGKQIVEINVESDFRYDSLESWEMNLDSLRISNFIAAADTSLIEMEGHANQDGAEFGRLFFNDGRGALSGDALLHWDKTEIQTVGYTNFNGAANLSNAIGDESVHLELHKDDNFFFVSAQANNFQSSRFVKNNFNFLVSGYLDFTQTNNEFWSVAFALSSLSGRLGSTDVNIKTNGTLDSKSLVLNETNAYFGGVMADVPFLTIDLDSNKFYTNAALYGELSDNQLNADLSLNADFAPIKSWFEIDSALKNFQGNMSVQNIGYSTTQIDEPFNLGIKRTDTTFSVIGGPRNMIRVQLDETGEFFASFSAPSPIKGTIVGLVKDGEIDAATSNFYIDLSNLWKYIPTQMVNFSGGFIIADIRVQGSIQDPGFFGSAVANSVKMGLPGFLSEDIGPTPCNLRLEGNEMILEPFVTAVGKSGECLVDGSFRFSRWIPRDFNLSLSVPSKHPIPIGLDISGFLADGKASGKLNIEKNEMVMRISGDVVCDEAELTMNFENNRANQAEERDSTLAIQTDITLTSGRKVEFLWPNADFPILRANAASGSHLAIMSDSQSEHFSVKGDVGLRGGELFYFQRSFYIRTGSLTFNETELSFDPHITTRAESRDRANSGAVTISMVIDDQPIRNFSPRLESNPPLSQVEILTLLGEKLTGTPGENNAIEQAFVTSTADVLAQFGVVRSFERVIRDFLHIDMFSVRTQALQNAILLNTLQRTNQIEPRIGNYFDNTTVFLGKYIGTDLFIQAMVSLRYDENRVEWGGLSIEPDLSIDFKAPIVDIRWEIMPRHGESLWIPDNRITISKKWSLP